CCRSWRRGRAWVCPTMLELERRGGNSECWHAIRPSRDHTLRGEESPWKNTSGRLSFALMAKNSQIEWTHHTFNPWWGCQKVSPACDNCYAELWAKRMGRQLWGKDAPRRFFSEAHWREPLKWNHNAQVAGIRERVFCASMADVFERRSDLTEQRLRLWELIRSTP